ncbi:MAG: twin-arginine translocase subunit TatC [Thermodesulfobacteriota bacterium]
MTDEKAAAARLTGHLRELRKRLLVSIVALVIGFAISYFFSERLYSFLISPLLPVMPEGSEFIAFSGLVEPFFVYIKVGFLGAAALASPVILFEIWSFVAPGLYATERRWFLATVFFSCALFISGLLFAFFVVFPFAFKFLMSYSGPQLKPFISMNSYFSLVTRLLIAFGVVYQLPLAMLVLARTGVVTAGRFLSWWRYAVIAIVIASAVLTPTPDAFNQMLMAGPLLVLYFLGVALARIFGKKKKVSVVTEDETDE